MENRPRPNFVGSPNIDTQSSGKSFGFFLFYKYESSSHIFNIIFPYRDCVRLISSAEC